MFPQDRHHRLRRLIKFKAPKTKIFVSSSLFPYGLRQLSLSPNFCRETYNLTIEFYSPKRVPTSTNRPGPMVDEIVTFLK